MTAAKRPGNVTLPSIEVVVKYANLRRCHTYAIYMCAHVASKNYISFLRMCAHFESTVWCQNYSYASKRKFNAVVDAVVTIVVRYR